MPRSAPLILPGSLIALLSLVSCSERSDCRLGYTRDLSGMCVLDESGVPKDSDDKVPPVDTGDPPFVDCVEDDSVFLDVGYTLAAVPTAVDTTWITAEAGQGSVIFWGVGMTTTTAPDPVDTTEHGAILVGLPARSELQFRLLQTRDGTTWCSRVYSTVTGSIPSDFPALALSDPYPGDSSGEFILVPMIDVNGSTLVVLDALGRYVWYRSTVDLAFRFAFSRNHGHFVYNTQASADFDGKVHALDRGGEELASIAFPQGHTDFTELPDGRFAMLGWEVRSFGDRRILGDTILENQDDGSIRTVWSIFDDLTPDLDKDWPKGFYQEEPDAEDWSHINGITYDSDDDAYYVTSRGLDALFKVDRASGDLVWTLGPSFPDFDMSQAPDILSLPHSVQVVGENEFLVFNHQDMINQECSDVRQFRVDIETHTVIQTWSHPSDECLMIDFLGNASRLSNGNTLISWSNAGEIQEVTPAGDSAIRINAPIGHGFAFLTHEASLY